MIIRTSIIFLCLGFVLMGASPMEIAVNDRNYKQAIVLQNEKIAATADPSEKEALMYELAFLYLKDQEQDKAFQVFLDLLNLTKSKGIQECYNEEIYKQILAVYLDPTSPSPQHTAQKLIDQVIPILKDRPQEYLLNYFAAIAYANLGLYNEFFKHFYTAYNHYPDHYLAYKTKAVLHIKLLERKREEKDRIIQRQAIIDNLVQAMQREPHDVNIYKMIIGFSPKEKKDDWIRECLNKIVNDNIMIPRSDIMFYVQEALDIKEITLAEKFVFRAREWYPQSRIVTEAEKKLESQKSK